jgi:hypothetical protein
MANKKDPNRPKRRHSPETILKMKEKRQARTIQPRSGTTKKAFNLYGQLKKDYKGHKDYDKIVSWIEENKHLLNTTAEETREQGLITDYSDQYSAIYEIRCGDIFFGDKFESDFNKSDDPYDLIDEVSDYGVNEEDEIDE